MTGLACTETTIETCSSGDDGCNVKTNRINRTLKKGIKGDDVKKLQEFLGLLADGSYGSQTAEKVKEWQLQNGLTPDGVFGSKSVLKAGLDD
jgi:peptidoglycan hydrolase-like protein with peptidoglycan-binding domain